MQLCVCVCLSLVVKNSQWFVYISVVAILAVRAAAAADGFFHSCFVKPKP